MRRNQCAGRDGLGPGGDSPHPPPRPAARRPRRTLSRRHVRIRMVLRQLREAERTSQAIVHPPKPLRARGGRRRRRSWRRGLGGWTIVQEVVCLLLTATGPCKHAQVRVGVCAAVAGRRVAHTPSPWPTTHPAHGGAPGETARGGGMRGDAVSRSSRTLAPARVACRSRRVGAGRGARRGGGWQWRTGRGTVRGAVRGRRRGTGGPSGAVADGPSGAPPAPQSCRGAPGGVLRTGGGAARARARHSPGARGAGGWPPGRPRGISWRDFRGIGAGPPEYIPWAHLWSFPGPPFPGGPALPLPLVQCPSEAGIVVPDPRPAGASSSPPPPHSHSHSALRPPWPPAALPVPPPPLPPRPSARARPTAPPALCAPSDPGSRSGRGPPPSPRSWLVPLRGRAVPRPPGATGAGGTAAASRERYCGALSTTARRAVHPGGRPGANRRGAERSLRGRPGGRDPAPARCAAWESCGKKASGGRAGRGAQARGGESPPKIPAS